MTFASRSFFARANQSLYCSSLHICVLPITWFFMGRPACEKQITNEQAFFLFSFLNYFFYTICRNNYCQSQTNLLKNLSVQSEPSASLQGHWKPLSLNSAIVTTHGYNRCNLFSIYYHCAITYHNRYYNTFFFEYQINFLAISTRPRFSARSCWRSRRLLCRSYPV